MAKQIIANAIALALASWESEPAAIAYEVVESFRTPEQATVWGRNVRVGAGWAALLNGTAVHFEDYDDTHMRTLLHAGPVIVPAALAMMEYCNASSSAVLEGVVFGTEIAMRIGNGISPAHYERGWHVTSTMGRIRCKRCRGTGRRLVRRADAQRNGDCCARDRRRDGHTRHDDQTVSPGKAAFDGIEAVSWPSGASQEHQVRSKAVRLAALMSDALDVETILGGLGERWEILTNSFKPYSCGLVSHPIIDAAIELRKRIAPEEIARVDVTVHPLVLDLMGKTDPQNGLESKFSAYHCGAIGFLFGAAGPQQFSDGCARDASVRDLRGKIAIERSNDVAVDAARMTVHGRNGGSEHIEIPHATGSIENPMSPAQLETKARALLGEHFDQLHQRLAAYGINYKETR